MPYALRNSSVLRWLQKQDDDDDLKRMLVESSKLQEHNAGSETAYLQLHVHVPRLLYPEKRSSAFS